MKSVSSIVKSICALTVLTLLGVAGLWAIAEAHEIWFYCPQKVIKAGETVRVEYGVGETLFEAPDSNWIDWLIQELPVVKVFVIDPEGEKITLQLKKDQNILAGSFVAKKKGSYLVYYVRENDYLTQTTSGWKRQKPEGLEDIIKAVKSNFYQKIIVNVEKSSKNYSRELGGLLEITPVDDPSKAKVGDEIRFKVTYKGKNAPMDVVVWGSFPGYSNRSHNWCYFGIPDKDGLVYFKPLHNGPWQVGAEKYPDDELLQEKQKTGIKTSFDTAVTFWIP
ncbi:MAG TPA: hypothetical protein DCY27_06290 [Desulfobacterales bacterium]|nr:hypothetical protein [Desulfobacterales bacterium]